MGFISSPCFVIFPLMAHGHTIPLLHLARLLRRRGISVAVITTPANAPSIRSFLKEDTKTTSIIELPFPNKPIDGVPPGVENTHDLPSIASFYEFAKATALMQPDFEKALEGLHPVGCIISDAMLGWTQETAAKLGVPRYFFFGMSGFATTLYQVLGREMPHAQALSPDEAFTFPSFPGLKLTRNDFEPPFNELEPSGPQVDFMIHQGVAMAKSQGLIVNSFYELETRYLEYWNNNIGPKAWCVGPLCLAAPTSEENHHQPCMQWLDHQYSPVLYVSFGTQSEISPEQLNEIAVGLERSETKFLWVIKPKLLKTLEAGFEERVKDRGVLVKDWVNQNGILNHKNVRGFLSHCGWNSVLESICAGVPILALPFRAEQHLNARFVTEEIGVGLRVMPRGGRSSRGFVGAEEVERMVKEMMEGKRGVEVRKRVEEVGEAAVKAMSKGGLSSEALDMLIEYI
ncbi:PREDICTED: UDP-glycosyltransferase 90A1-like [Ipomoea nil]|uniref:UDP-glycosyltransferase 90A1-like n=1 Tax=Ipomoea nil TaxID=35883 RepID=UPI000900A216|nr:PREDICTED: UDP-glycosyltransferase 90A1-like [Ipomoea nil]